LAGKQKTLVHTIEKVAHIAKVLGAGSFGIIQYGSDIETNILHTRMPSLGQNFGILDKI
jgi:hypothetical protein